MLFRSIVKGYYDSHPNSGMGYLRGYLRSQGLCVQHCRIRKSVEQVDQLGQALRCHTVAKKVRKKYKVDRPNSLWHIDGHHKLILWGIIIHGIIDGYTRKVHHESFAQ